MAKFSMPSRKTLCVVVIVPALTLYLNLSFFAFMSLHFNQLREDAIAAAVTAAAAAAVQPCADSEQQQQQQQQKNAATTTKTSTTSAASVRDHYRLSRVRPTETTTTTKSTPASRTTRASATGATPPESSSLRKSQQQQQQQRQQQSSLPLASTGSSTSHHDMHHVRKTKNAQLLAKFSNHSLEPLIHQHFKGTCEHVRRHETEYSSIEYVACCGLGHRLSRMSAAAHVAATMGAALHGKWGCCDDGPDVFTYLFGDEPIIFQNVHSNNNSTSGAAIITTTTSTASTLLDHDGHPFHIQFRNEVPGVVSRMNIPAQERCPCTDNKIDTDYAFYLTLMERYQSRQQVLDFMEQNDFSKHTVVGLHVRAGNGETGDFAKKGRHISDKEAFVRTMGGNITLLTKDAPDPPLLFIATDTPSYVDAFREALKGTMSVVDLPQLRPKEGEGVMFGEHKGFKSHARETCESGWDSVFQDMMILSHSDVLLVATTSSFTQTMPLSMALGRPHRKMPDTSFCEMRPQRGLHCYKDAQDWCCHGTQGNGHAVRDVHVDWRDLF